MGVGVRYPGAIPSATMGEPFGLERAGAARLAWFFLLLVSIAVAKLFGL